MRLGLLSMGLLVLGTVGLGVAGGPAHGRTAQTQDEEFASSAECPDAATARIYEQQLAIGAQLTGEQRAQHDAAVEAWYDRRVSECRLQALNQQLAQYAEPLQQASQFTYQMRLAAERMLQAAGQISKAMTDAMDVTKHNDVGIGVALSGYIGALGYLGEGIGLAANGYQKAAIAVQAAEEQQALRTLAGVAETEAQIAAEEASQLARNVTTEVGKPPVMGSPEATPSSALPDSEKFLNDVQIFQEASANVVPQGNLPTCGPLACQRLANLVGKNISVFQALNEMRFPLSSQVVTRTNAAGKVVAELKVTGGRTAQQLADGLNAMGVPADVGAGLANMMNEVRAGNPVIAGIKTSTAPGAPLHAVVVEAAETRAGVPGLSIYDPAGFAYWKPLSSFERFFDGTFVRPL